MSASSRQPPSRPPQALGNVRTSRRRFGKFKIEAILKSHFSMLPGLPDIQRLLSAEFRYSSLRHLPPTLRSATSLISGAVQTLADRLLNVLDDELVTHVTRSSIRIVKRWDRVALKNQETAVNEG